MATVVSVGEFQKRFDQLGWKLNLAEIVDGLRSANVAAAVLIAYLDAAIASPAGFDDQTIAGCPPAVATKITTYLRGAGVEAI